MASKHEWTNTSEASTYWQCLQSANFKLKALDLCLFVSNNDPELLDYIAVLLLSCLQTLLRLLNSIGLLQ